MQELQAAENRQFSITSSEETPEKRPNYKGTLEASQPRWLSHHAKTRINLLAWSCLCHESRKTIKKVPLWTLENENSIILWWTTDSLKERQPSPQNLGRAACKLWGRGKPHNLAYFETNDSTKITYNYNFKRETTITSETWAPPVSSEGEGSPIINLAYFKNKWHFKNHLQKLFGLWPTFQKRDYLHLRILGAPPVSSEGEDSRIICPIK